ncbi:MAG: hypothetical protein ACK5NT_03095 [Pyrinomonadaceae bacterium]
MQDLLSANFEPSIAPLGAGDLVDRAIRFYRENFWTFVFIASPPVLIGLVALLGWTMLARNLFNVNAQSPDEEIGYRIFLYIGSIVIYLIQIVATLTVMGGACRNFVRHLLYGEPIGFRATYKSVRNRFWGLISASSILTSIFGFIGVVVFYLVLIAVAIMVMLAAYVLESHIWLASLVSILVSLIAFAVGWILYFLVISRFIYVPQVMLVEGQGVFSAISRSVTLAGNNVWRVSVLVLFTTVATWSALAILYLPIGWIAWVRGIPLVQFQGDFVPIWFQIAGSIISQVSIILLVPVWMIGLSLLYIDDRVRREGYDIELMAAANLGDIPAVPDDFQNPLLPALSNSKKIPKKELPKNRGESLSILK